MRTAADHLENAIRELKSERDAALKDANAQIQILEDTLQTLRGESKDVQTNGDVPDARLAGSRSAREIILEFAEARAPKPFSLNEVVNTVHAEGNDAKSASISSIISRLTADGALERGPRRGTYRKDLATAGTETEGGALSQERADAPISNFSGDRAASAASEEVPDGEVGGLTSSEPQLTSPPVRYPQQYS